MYCVTLLTTYVCSNGSGTTCTKQAVTIPVTSVGTCAPSDGILLSNAEYTTLASTVTTANTTAGTAYSLASQNSTQLAQGLNLTVLPYQASQEDYDAVTAIFAVLLLAMVVVWGYHRVMDFFSTRPEY